MKPFSKIKDFFGTPGGKFLGNVAGGVASATNPGLYMGGKTISGLSNLFSNRKQTLPNGEQYNSPVPSQGSKPEVPADNYNYAGKDNYNTSKASDSDVAYATNIIQKALGGGVDLHSMEEKNTTMPDVDKFYRDINMGNPGLTDMYSMRNSINNRRNDIAVGEVSPYDIEDKYGVVFDPNQTRSVQKQAAGIYDPMLEEINAKILSEEKARESALTNAAGAGQLSNKQVSQALQMANSLKAHPAYKDMLDISTGMQGVTQGLAQQNGFGDIAAMNAFQRMIDPGATVREGDVALMQSASALKERILSDYPIEKLQKGAKLPQAVRDQMKKLAEELYGVRSTNYNDIVGNQYRMLAEASGIPYEYIGSDFASDYGMGGGSSSMQNGGFDPVTPEEIQGWLNSGAITPQEAQELSQMSFNNVGGGTKLASPVTSLQDAMSRIARNESDGSGGYKALGPVVTKGQYKGERALGKYQIMPGNLPQWSQEALGYQVTPQQFMANPQLQEAIAADRLMKIYKQYGNWNDVASVWFTGKPLSQGANAKDDLGTSGLAYVKKFIS